MSVRIDPFELALVGESAAPVPVAAIGAEAAVARRGGAARAEPLRYEGPFDRTPWPSQIVAHVVAPGAGEERRVAGYAVGGDLARHCGMVDVAWLALRGELPTTVEREAFDAALVLLAPVHVGEAPGHAAHLSRLAGAPAAATVAVGALALGELGDHERAELAAWMVWLAADPAARGPVPAGAQFRLTPAPGAVAGTGAVPRAEATDGTDGRAADPGALRLAEADLAWAAVQTALSARMRGWFGAAAALPDVPLRRVACAYAILHHLGLRPGLVLETVVAWARLPAVMAEASHVRAGAIRDYPARLPDYQYVDDEGAAP